MTGERYGHWVCLEPRPKGKWLCKCDCGTVREVARKNLISGDSTNCGCQTSRQYYLRGATNKEKFRGCDEDCLNCRYTDCMKPDYMCTYIPELTRL